MNTKMFVFAGILDIGQHKSQNICVKNAWLKNPSYLKKIVLELFQNWSKDVPKLSQSCASYLKVVSKLS